MLLWYEGLIIIGYLAGMGLVASLIVRWLRREKDLAPHFEAVFFLRYSLVCAVLGQLGLVAVACGMFWTRQALAVGISALIGMPGVLVVTFFMQWGFFRRYSRLGNLIRRLEQLGPIERAHLLESLPPEIFVQLPGDYRVVTWEEHRR